MSNKNYPICKFYSRLYELQDLLKNQIIPLGFHLQIKESDPKLIEGMEILSQEIDEHLEKIEFLASIKKLESNPNS